MNRKEAYKKMDGKCEQDYKKKHRWEHKGLSLTGHDCSMQEVFQCHQCRKIIRIDVEEIV